MSDGTRERWNEGAPVVVEVNVALYHPVCMLKGVEALLTVDTFHLYLPVDTLGYGVVGGIIVLTHGDGYPLRLRHPLADHPYVGKRPHGMLQRQRRAQQSAAEVYFTMIFLHCKRPSAERIIKNKIVVYFLFCRYLFYFYFCSVELQMLKL